jgi:3-hydroxybutyryl-CoA dehydrogenase
VVEVIAAPSTAAATLESLAGLVRTMGKRPIVVRHDVPGFVWNRLQFALLRECLQLLEDGVADAEAIDAAVADGLAPRWIATGPLATTDLGGIETFARIAAELNGALAAGSGVSPELSGRARSGATFHRWDTESRRASAELRAEALAVGARFGVRRREIMAENG